MLVCKSQNSFASVPDDAAPSHVRLLDHYERILGVVKHKDIVSVISGDFVKVFGKCGHGAMT